MGTRFSATVATWAILIASGNLMHAQDSARWSWQEPHAKVLPTGDLEWAPTNLACACGTTARQAGP